VVVTVTAENAAGLTATATRVFEVVPDSEVTVRTIARLVDGDLGWWNRGPVTLVIERVADPGSTAGMMLAKLATSSNWMGTNDPVIEWPFDEEGVHIVEHFAEAESGTTAIRSTTVRIDMTSPSILFSPDAFNRDEVPVYQP